MKDRKEIKKTLERGDKLYDDGNIVQAQEAYKRVVELSHDHRFYDLAVEAFLRLGPLYSRQNDYPEMIKVYDDALVLTKTHGLKSMEPMVYKRIGDGYWRVGALGLAKEYYKKCEETLHHVEDEFQKRLLRASLYIDGYGNLLDEEGKFKEAISYYRRSLKLLDGYESEEKDNRVHLYQIYAKYNMGVAYERHGIAQEKTKQPAKRSFREGIKYFEEVRSMCKSSSYEFAISTLDAGFCYSRIGMIDKAEQYTEQAVKVLSKPRINAKDLLAWAFMNKGIIARERNDFNDAVKNFNRAIEIYETIGIHEWVAMVYSELGLTYKIRGDKKKSRDAYRHSQRLIEEDMVPEGLEERALEEKIEQS